MALVLGLSCEAPGSDVFNTASQIPNGPATAVLHDSADPCRQSPLASPLPLFEAIERSLCESPKTRTAWATVKAAAAGLGQSKALYLPALDATGLYAAEHDVTDATDVHDVTEVHNVTQVSGPLELQTSISQPVNSESLALSWVLYDFGGREATFRNSKQLLLAAQANQNLILQTTFLNTAVDYYSAQAANAVVEAARRIESDAKQTLNAATGRYQTGVAPVTDELQAKTAWAQAAYQRAVDEGMYKTVIGKLAIDMSLAADEPLKLPDLDQGALPDTQFVHAVHDLIEEASQTHPAVLAARAQWQAALENIRVARALGLPKLGITGTLSRSNAPVTTNLGQPEFPGLSRQASIGIGIEFPLFQGFGWVYKIRQAEALADAQEQGLRDAQQQVELSVWSSFQSLQTATENLSNVDTVLQSARQSFDAAEHRYQVGVGSILEVLNSQALLGTAEQEWIQSQLSWRTARLQLAASLGQLGMWAVR